MMRVLPCITMLLALLATGAKPNLARAAPTATSVLPDSTKAFFCTEDVGKLTAAWRKTEFYQLYKSEPMKAFVEDVDRRLNPVENVELPPLGLSWDDIELIAAGEVAWAAVPVGDKAAFVLWVDTTGKQDQVEEITRTLAKRYDGFDARRSTPTIAEQKTIQYEYEHQGSDAGQSVKRIYFHKDNIFGVSDSEELLATLFSRWNGQSGDRLAASAAFHYVTTECRKNAEDTPRQFCWFLDPFGYADLMRSTRGEELDEDGRLLREQGFTAIQAVGGVAAFAAGDYDLLHRTVVYAPGNFTKAAQALNFPRQKSFQIPKWIPADLACFTLIDWDFTDALAGYGSWFDATAGEGEEGTFNDVVEGIKVDQDGPRVDIRKEVVGNLTGPVSILEYDVERKPDVENHVLYAVKTKDAKVMETAVRKMFLGDPEVDQRKLGDVVVWVFRQRDPDDDDALLGPDLSNYAICVAHGYLLVASHVGFVEKVLATASADPLAGSAAIERVIDQQAKLKLPTTFARRLSHTDLAFRSTYNLFRAGRINEATTLTGRVLAALFAADEQADSQPTVSTKKQPNAKTKAKPASQTRQLPSPLSKVDVKKLPPYEAVRDYLHTSGMLATNVREGWLIVGFTFAKQKAK